MIAGTKVIPLDKSTSPIEIAYHQAIRFGIKRNTLVPEELALNM
jgi:hypothetical protein